jgi:site-specific DNA-methyltransferase (adenine-specific)
MCCDVIEGLKKIPDNSVSLSFSSVPYNCGVEYLASDDNLPYQEYLDWLKNVFSEILRVLKSGGRMVINVDAVTNTQDDKDDSYIRCVYADFYSIAKEVGFKFRCELLWCKQNSPGSGTAWGSYLSSSSPCIRRNHEYLLVFSKDKWRLDGDPELSDMTKEEFHKYTLSVWNDITPETSKKSGHPAPFPVELCKRIIKLYSYREDTVLDPFSGSGSCPLASRILHRNYIGIDICKEYCDYAINRIKEYDESLVLSGEEEYVPRSERIRRDKELKLKKEQGNG